MKNPALFHVLLDHLESVGAPPREVQRFVERWHRLRPHESFPCPACFLAGEEQPLMPLKVRGGFQPMVCTACHTCYDVATEDE
ncbi:hypothetical protein EVC45_38400 [Paraburkholderia sp. UYCP14C]|uniref:hypothetical protein n=1 Tax=Paraburkholderia sp. UYCP14C TaxID=2511130 RepID=UPI001020513D|nr:hypothetical protein [Paraburkholderia sp. UYCP14C]RZF24488.1 hypothetical protein EVC45_38400 [Paraburkholderia sp. UYCP14C]